MSDTLLTRYLADIAEYPTVSDDEARQLAVRRAAGVEARRILDAGAVDVAERVRLRRAAAAGEEAGRSLVQAHLRLVVDLVRPSVTVGGPPPLDVIQQGNVGLMEAVATFAPGGEITFAEHVATWVRRSVDEGLAGDDV